MYKMYNFYIRSTVVGLKTFCVVPDSFSLCKMINPELRSFISAMVSFALICVSECSWRGWPALAEHVIRCEGITWWVGTEWQLQSCRRLPELIKTPPPRTTTTTHAEMTIERLVTEPIGCLQRRIEWINCRQPQLYDCVRPVLRWRR